MALVNNLVGFAHHQESFAAMRQAKARYELNVRARCGNDFTELADPDVTLRFEARKVVTSRHRMNPIHKEADSI
ncbi:hypothetical protein [Pseudomonas grimontii]|uniref:hypothetical protein n=1 Tax=Pseudomonas grimontii TaxID=129847 RepID=UPI00387B5ADD